MNKNSKENIESEKLTLKENHEFMDGVKDEFDPRNMKGISRRNFLALLTASSAFAVSSCSDYYDQGELVPYTNRPVGELPGKPVYYASTCSACSNACGMLIKTREGRPIKLDGNLEHPISKGKICSIGQASILNLYDPERLRSPMKENRKSNWRMVDAEIIPLLANAATKGKQIAIVTNSIISPTAKKVLRDFQSKYPTAVVYSYDLFNDNNRKTAWEKSYPNTPQPAIDISKADVILALENDFLGREGNTIEHTRQFASRRDVIVSSDFNRLYVAEGGMSLTGVNSDYRMPVRPDAQFEFVMALLNEIVNNRNVTSGSLDSKAKSALKKYSLTSVETKLGLDKKKIDYLVNDLINNQGKSFVYAGNTLPENVHIAVNLLNEVLGNSSIYNFSSSFVDNEISSLDNFKTLVDDLNKGNVEVLIHFDSDPVYHLPVELNYLSAMKKAGLIISLTESKNDSSENAYYVLPINHNLESWGDAFVRENVYNLQQPVIDPLYESRQKEAILLNWSYGDKAKYTNDIYHKYLMASFKEEIYDKKSIPISFKEYWFNSLELGFAELNFENKSSSKFNSAGFSSIQQTKSSDDFIVKLSPSYFIGDGKYANNGWLQELPHPVTKVTWDNYAAISPTTAKSLNVENNDIIEVTVSNQKLKLPVMIQLGMANNLIEVELGQGRKVIGDVGAEHGFNANILQNSNSKYSRWITGASVKVENTFGSYELVSSQQHHSLTEKLVKDLHFTRKIIQEGTVEEYKSNPNFIKEEKEEIYSITNEMEYNGNKWAMAIDLNKCTNCAVCVSSCNVENNVPVVGKEQVSKGREMQWLRLDRYYSGTDEDPITSWQPMLCQHCDNAPCENVCPVNATNHSPDGLNQMVYNRCVGTRYCANNCPYKVRRFNFFNFRDHFQDAYYDNEVTPLVYNPEVTVRSRGVMEKCSFCVQKISDARENAIREKRELLPDEIVTACQSACPADAIFFGDSNNEKSSVIKYREHELGYYVLEETNVKPNVTYIAKLRNTRSEES